MNVLRTWLMTAMAIAIAPAPGWAQETAPKAEAKAPTRAKVTTPDGPFLVKPYLQLGHSQAIGKLVLVWHAADAEAEWAVEYKPGPGTRWQAAETPSAVRVAVGGIEPHRVYHASMTGLEPGTRFAYRVSRGGKAVFEAEARTRRWPASPNISSSSATAAPAPRSRTRSPIGRSYPSPIT